MIPKRAGSKGLPRLVGDPHVTQNLQHLLSRTMDVMLAIGFSDLGDVDGPVELDWGRNGVAQITLIADVEITFSRMVEGGAYTLIVRQDSAGDHQITWPDNLAWPSGAAPPASTEPGSVDIYTFLAGSDADVVYGVGQLGFS